MPRFFSKLLRRFDRVEAYDIWKKKNMKNMISSAAVLLFLLVFPIMKSVQGFVNISSLLPQEIDKSCLERMLPSFHARGLITDAVFIGQENIRRFFASENSMAPFREIIHAVQVFSEFNATKTMGTSSRKQSVLALVASSEIEIETFLFPANWEKSTLMWNGVKKNFKRFAKVVAFVEKSISGKSPEKFEKIVKSVNSQLAPNKFYVVTMTNNEDEKNSRCEIRHVCLHCCANGKTCVVQLKRLNIFPWKNELDFRGTQLRTVCYNYFKNCWKVGPASSDDVGTFDGSDYRLLRILEDSLNFTTVIKVPPASEVPGIVLPNGTATGVLGRIQRREVDFVMSNSPTVDRELVLDFSTPYEYSGFMWVQSKPMKLNHGLDAFTTFSPPVWISVLIIIIAVFAADRFISNITSMRTGEPMISLVDNWMVMVKTLLRQEDIKEKPKPVSYRCLYGGLSVGFTFMAIIYNELYFERLMDPIRAKTVETTSDVIEGTKQWLAYNGSIYENFAQFKPLGSKAVFQDNSERQNVFKWIQKYPDRYLGLIPASQMSNPSLGSKELIASLERGDFYVGQEFGPELFKGVAFEENSPLTEAFSTMILRMHTAGIATQSIKFAQIEAGLESTTFQQLKYNQRKEKKTRKISTLPLSSFSAIIWVYFSLCGLSLAVFLAEILSYQLESPKRKKNCVPKRFLVKLPSYDNMTGTMFNFFKGSKAMKKNTEDAGSEVEF